MTPSTRFSPVRSVADFFRPWAWFVLAALLPACGTPLIQSIRQGDEAAFRSLVEDGGERSTPYRGLTPLMWAAREGQVGMVGTLLDRGALVDERDPKGNTALLWAAIQRSRAAAALLVKRGASVNVRNGAGTTPLLAATDSADEALSRLLVDAGADVNAQDRYGYTPLILAAGADSLEIVRFLVEKGADLNRSDVFGNSPLIMAAGGGNAEMARILIRKGADVRTRDNEGTTATMSALKYDRRETARVLLEEAHGDVNAADVFGNTALCFAVRPRIEGGQMNENVALVELLLKSGAAVNHQNTQGATPLMLAALFGATSTVETLLKHGADPKMTNLRKDTAADHASEKSSYYESTSDTYLPDHGRFARVAGRCRQNYGAVVRVLAQASGPPSPSAR